MADLSQTTTNPLSARDRWEITGGFLNSLADAYATIRATDSPPETLPTSFFSSERSTGTPGTVAVGNAVMVIGAVAIIILVVKAIKG